MEVTNFLNEEMLPEDADVVSVAICQKFAELAVRNQRLVKSASEAREIIDRCGRVKFFPRFASNDVVFRVSRCKIYEENAYIEGASFCSCVCVCMCTMYNFKIEFSSLTRRSFRRFSACPSLTSSPCRT